MAHLSNYTIKSSYTTKLEETDSIKDEMTLQKTVTALIKNWNGSKQKLVRIMRNFLLPLQFFFMMALTEIPKVEEIVIGYCG